MTKNYERIEPNAVNKWIVGDFTDVGEIKENLYNFALSISGDHDLSEEAVQEAITHILERGIDTFYPAADSDPWLRQVVANKIRDIQRKKKRRRTSSLNAFIEEGEEDQLSKLIIDEKSLDPQKIYSPEIDIYAKKVMEYITERCKSGNKRAQAFYLYRIKGKTHAQIIEALQIPEGSVKSGIRDTTIEIRERFPEIAEYLKP